MKTLVILIGGSEFFPNGVIHPNYDDGNWVKLIDECLDGKRTHISVWPYSHNDLFRRKFFEPHLDEDGYFKKDHFNRLYATDWKNKKIIDYVVFDMMLHHLDEDVERLKKSVNTYVEYNKKTHTDDELKVNSWPF
jgi:hypothetical protein